MMRYLRHGSLLALLVATGCAQRYEKKLTPVSTSVTDYGRWDLPNWLLFHGKPDQRSLYRCYVNAKVPFKKIHLSGLLLFRHQQANSTRVVFTSEMGYTFFDFDYSFFDSFKVRQIIHQLDKPELIKTLRQDFAFLLGLAQDYRGPFRRGDTTYYKTRYLDAHAYYIVDDATRRLQRIEVAGRKLRTTIRRFGPFSDSDMPDSFSIQHQRALFTIAAKKIERYGQ